MTPVLDGRAWVGTANAYGTNFIVELFESKRHPGYYHQAVACFADGFLEESTRPFKATVLQGMLNSILKHHGLVVEDLEWEEAKAEDLVLSGYRVETA